MARNEFYKKTEQLHICVTKIKKKHSRESTIVTARSSQVIGIGRASDLQSSNRNEAIVDGDVVAVIGWNTTISHAHTCGYTRGNKIT